jgi:hypothetical protein
MRALCSKLFIDVLDFTMFDKTHIVHQCTASAITAGRLAASRHIYFREELRIIAKQIQSKHRHRLPVLNLIAIAAYEQVFNRQVSCQIFPLD